MEGLGTQEYRMPSDVAPPTRVNTEPQQGTVDVVFSLCTGTDIRIWG